MASSLVPKDPSLHIFRIRHPDLQPNNVIVSTSPDSDHLEIAGLLDWQHTPILPQLLLAGIPGRLRNYNDPVSRALTPPSPPENVDKLDEYELTEAMELYHDRLVHFHYVKNTEEHNKLHHDVLSDPVCTFIRNLFNQAGAPWKAETNDLKALLIQATELWELFVGAGVPCPVEFEPEECTRRRSLAKSCS